MFIYLLPFRFRYSMIYWLTWPNLLVLLGDFNAVLDATLDSSNLNRMGNPDLVSWATVVGHQSYDLGSIQQLGASPTYPQPIEPQPG